MEINRYRRGRAGVAGIVAAVILFAMLFTVGTGYFMYVNSSNTLYNAAVSTRNSAVQHQLAESAQVTTLKLSDGNMGAYLNNTGGIGLNITSLYVQYSGKSKALCMGVGLPAGCSTPSSTTFPSCQFPVFINIGKGTSGIPLKLVTGGCTTTLGTSSGCTSSIGSLSTCIDTGQPANTTTASLKFVTQRGTVISATYPETATALAAQALSSGAIGDLYLSHASYTWYTVGTCGSGTCLTKQGAAFSIPYATATADNIAFSVTVTDLNPQQKSIALDQYTQLYQIVVPVNLKASSYKTNNWYIISVNNGTYTDMVANAYSQVTLAYNQPTTLYFGSLNAGTFSGIAAQNAVQDTGILVFILTHGCEAQNPGTCVPTSANYGQNMPYVSTIYY